MVFEIVGLIMAILVCYILYKVFKAVGHLLINTIAGFLLLFLLSFFGITIKITIFSLLIIAFSGVVGVFIVLIFQFFGLL